ncbi:hypothetical protein HPG69_007032 [Diceros bicornis minor]|uniref:EGF-like calcium-binding domain-containing protein n=1 Tax=Diceros bicornis minor TaxID=77932 RepID=A0A7J7F398_DICBM|nr:hypothetical protein HPG69_007032 [Diceros bicornis minor]
MNVRWRMEAASSAVLTLWAPSTLQRHSCCVSLSADINECAEGLAHCGHRCVNTVGSFTCACHPCFELGADGKQCYRIELEIVNSCERNNGGCSHHCEPVNMYLVGPVVPVTMDTSLIQMRKHA